MLDFLATEALRQWLLEPSCGLRDIFETALNDAIADCIKQGYQPELGVAANKVPARFRELAIAYVESSVVKTISSGGWMFEIISNRLKVVNWETLCETYMEQLLGCDYQNAVTNWVAENS